MSAEEDEEEKKRRLYYSMRIQNYVNSMKFMSKSDGKKAIDGLNRILEEPDFIKSKFGREFNLSLAKEQMKTELTDEDKEEGNKFARMGEYDKAIECYTSGIQKKMPNVDLRDRTINGLGFPLAVLFANRSEMYFRKGEYYWSLLDGLTVLECIVIADKSTDINFMFSIRCLDLLVKTRLRLSRILSGSSGNYSASNQHLTRTMQIHHLDKKWLEKLFKESLRLGTLFWKREHIYRNPQWEERRDFSRFCVNVKNVRTIPLRISRKLKDEIQFREFNSFSFDRKKCQIYVFGGRNSTFYSFGRVIKYSNSLLILDLKKRELCKSEQYGQVPSERAHHKTVIYKRKMYLFGGEHVNIPEPSNASTAKLHPFFVLDLDTKKWEKLPSSLLLKDRFDRPLCLHDHCMTVIGDFMYVYGGAIPRPSALGDMFDVIELGDFYSYNFVTQKWKILLRYDYTRTADPRYPLPRKRAAMWAMNQCLYLWGGECCEQCESFKNRFGVVEKEEDSESSMTNRTFHNYSRLWKYDIAKKTWERCIQTGCAPSKRAEFNVFVYRKKAYTFGGFAYEGLTADPLNGKFVRVPHFTYFKDCYEFSLWNVEGNEMIGRNGLMKNKTVHWRRILFPKKKVPKVITKKNHFWERAQVHVFQVVQRKLYLWGGYLGGKEPQFKCFWNELVEIEFEKMKECGNCLKRRKNMMKCARCGKHYCDRKCQKSDWRHHKLFCVKKKKKK